MLTLNQIDLYNIGCYPVNNQTGGQLITLVKQAMATNTMLVFLFHGVGGEHTLNVSLTAHSQLLHFLKQNQNDIWVAPLVEVAEFIKSNQAQHKVMN